MKRLRATIFGLMTAVAGVAFSLLFARAISEVVWHWDSFSWWFSLAWGIGGPILPLFLAYAAALIAAAALILNLDRVGRWYRTAWQRRRALPANVIPKIEGVDAESPSFPPAGTAHRRG